LAGSLMAVQLGTMTQRNFESLSSLVVFSLGVFTGAQFVEGAIIAGVLTVALPEVLRQLGLPLDLAELLFGVGAVQALHRGVGIGSDLRAKIAGKFGDRSHAGAPMPRIELVGPRKAEVIRMQPEPALEVKDLTVRYGEVLAVNRVSLRVDEKSIVALIGPNGAGKSTVIDAVSGFVGRYEGVIRLDGVTVDHLPPYRRARVGLRRTFQQGRAVPDLRVVDYLRLSAGHHITDQEVDDVLRYFGCPPRETMIGTIEIGLRRLVEIAAAVAAGPRVVLLDEPAAGLSSEQSKLLAERISQIPDRFGCSVLLVEHDMDLVKSICDTITVIDFGSVIASGPPEKTLQQIEVVAAYLGAEVA
jgi:branched-chain amino acid transport system permease protein